jgi:polyvinyl alcohol dehydrogenase (cytochrome)
MKTTKFGGIIAAFTLLLASCGDSQDAPDAAEADVPSAVFDGPQSARADLAGQETGSEDHPGREVFDANCASCHMGGVDRAAHVSTLRMLPYDTVSAAISEGIMLEQAAHLTDQERDDVAFYLTGGPITEEFAMPPQCSEADTAFDWSRPPFATGWGLNHGNTRFIPDDVAQFSPEDLDGLELKWAFAYPHANRARSQPSFVGGSLVLGSQDGTVYALNAERGCIRWTFRAKAEVRTGMTLSSWEAGQQPENPPMAYFADIFANTYGVNVVTGELVWSTKVDGHPNATNTAQPALYEGVVYQPVSSLEVVPATDPNYECCTFRGSLVALDAATGEQLWKTETIPEPLVETGLTSAGTMNFGPSGAPIWNSTTIDVKRRLLYNGTGENYSSPAQGSSDAIIAFSMDSGEIAWVRQTTSGDAWNVACVAFSPDQANCPIENGPDVDFASPPILISDGERDILVAGQKSGDVHGINPDDGALVWTRKVGRGGTQGGIHFGLAAEGTTVYVPISDYDDGAVVVEDAVPGLYGLDAFTGEVKWSSLVDDVCGDRFNCDPGASAVATAIPGLVIQGYMDGVLRIHDGATGEVLWQFDADRDFTTISGESAHGGSFAGGSGAIMHHGLLYANSGYGIYNHMPGNVLLVFGKGGK